MSDCPFCERRDNGDFEQLYAGVVMRFEPLNPVTEGHMLFMPAEHVEHPHPDALATAMRYAGKYAVEQSEDYNLITSSGSAATQTIPHMHIHYVPRRVDDGLHLPWSTHDAERVRELQGENERLQGRLSCEEAEVGRLWANLDESREYAKKALTERDAAREQVRQRDEVVERVRALTDGPSTMLPFQDIRAALDGDGR